MEHRLQNNTIHSAATQQYNEYKSAYNKYKQIFLIQTFLI